MLWHRADGGWRAVCAGRGAGASQPSASNYYISSYAPFRSKGQVRPGRWPLCQESWTQVSVVVDGALVLVLDAGTGEAAPARGPGCGLGPGRALRQGTPGLQVRAIRPRSELEKDFRALGPAAEAFNAGAAGAGHIRLGPELAELNTLVAAL